MTEAPSKNPTWLIATRVAILVALMGSAALYVQYLDPAGAAFCGLRSGCETVRRSSINFLFDSPLFSVPLFGLVAFAVVFVMSVMVPRDKATVALTYAGGVFGLLLLATQAFLIKAFCWLCATVDGAAMLAAIFTVLAAQRNKGNDADPLRAWTWAALAILALAAPPLWVAVKPLPPVPPVISALYEPGKINVVEFADFECPFCRALHPILQGVIASYPPGQVLFLRKHVPLKSHEDARPAARAAVCAEQQGLGEKLADRLVQIDLSAVAIRRAALEIGADAGKLDACLATTMPDQFIDEDTKLLTAAGFDGLPTTYVGGKRLLGAVPESTIRDAFEHARRGEGPGGVAGPVYTACLAGVLGALIWLGRKTRGTI